MINMMNNTKQKIGELTNQKPIEVLFEGADTDIYGKTNEFSKDLLDEMNQSKKLLFSYMLDIGYKEIWVRIEKISVCW